VLTRLDALPEGEYALDEALEALDQVRDLIREAGTGGAPE
jgi:hypothetical protein